MEPLWDGLLSRKESNPLKSAPRPRLELYPALRTPLHIGDRRQLARTKARDIAAIGLEDDPVISARLWSHDEVVAVRILVRLHGDLSRVKRFHSGLAIADLCTLDSCDRTAGHIDSRHVPVLDHQRDSLWISLELHDRAFSQIRRDIEFLVQDDVRFVKAHACGK